jgi:UTP:GlnB (protein PII) uridylyltransferase
MIIPSVNLILKQCHNQWRSSLFRTIVVINRRQLATKGQQKKDSKSQKNDTLVQSTTDNQIEVATFKEKGKKNISQEIFYM